MSSTLTRGIKNGLYIVLTIILLMMMSRDGSSQSFYELESPLINSAHTNAWNVAWVDVNGDGFDDLFLPEYGTNITSHVYLNDGFGNFYESQDSEDLVAKVAGSISSSWADIDNDGDRDAHIANFTGGPNFLIINNNDGTFTDATNDMNPNSVGYFHGSTWADYNNDGFVDLFTSSFQPTKFSELYFNNGDGTFSQELESPVAYHTGRSIGSTWVDYDNDGWQDLFIPNGNGQDNSLFHNLGNGEFEPIVTGDLVNDGSNSVASCWGDVDNDGDMDLFVSNTSNQDNLFYWNNGDGSFTKELADVIATDGGQSHGCNFIDYDNDGDLDLYVLNTDGQANKLYKNDGSGSFSINPDGVIGYTYGFPYSQAWSDYDKDGDLDVFITNVEGDADKLIVNHSTSNNWVQFKLSGTSSNRSAIGAAIRVFSGGNSQMRQVNSQGGFGSQNSLHQHFGLGNSTTIDSVIINWPSGYYQRLVNVPINQFHNIEEDNAGLVTGRVFNDHNGNCISDPGEEPLSNVRLSINSGEIFTATDENGVFCLKLPLGEFTIECENPEYWTSSCALSQTIQINQIGQVVQNIDFGKEPLDLGPDLSVDFAAAAQRRGFTNFLMFSYANHGTEPDYNRWVELKVPDGVFLVSASEPWDMVVGNTYLWQFDTLNPGQAGSVIIVDSVGLELAVGDSVLFYTSITTYLDELDTWNDAVSSVEPIVGAIDPNDIQVSPKGFGDKGIIDRKDTLIYRIRFQNVGTYAAQNIYIKDELPDELDVSTVEIINMSHQGNYWVEGNTINWKFLNINLPDSNANEQASHGFVTFSVVPSVDVPPGEEIINNASIEFDFEAPLQTNSTLNTIKEMSSAEHNVLEIYPNPMNETASFRLKRNREIFEDRVAIVQYAIYDYTGKMVKGRTSMEQFSEQIDRTGLESGTYIIMATDSNNEIHKGKLVVSNTNKN